MPRPGRPRGAAEGQGHSVRFRPTDDSGFAGTGHSTGGASKEGLGMLNQRETPLKRFAALWAANVAAANRDDHPEDTPAFLAHDIG
jgi:hypothetical protein